MLPSLWYSYYDTWLLWFSQNLLRHHRYSLLAVEDQAQGHPAFHPDEILAYVQVPQLLVATEHGCQNVARDGGEVAFFQPAGHKETEG